MGEALGFTTVPLTPGGSVAVEAEEAAAAAAAVAGQQRSEDERRAAAEEEEAALQAAAVAAQGEDADNEISELSSFRTTSDE